MCNVHVGILPLVNSMNSTRYVISSSEEVSVYIEKLSSGNVNTFGFDTETTIDRVVDKGFPSVVQIHTSTECYIFQVYRMWKRDGCFPSRLSKFLSNPHYIKVGIGSENDVRQLEQCYSMRCSGIIDVQHIARSMNLVDISMDGLARKYIPHIPKGNKSSIYTNWDIDLSEKHIQYAATDGLLSLLIYKQMFNIQDTKIDTHAFVSTVEDDELLRWLSQGGRLPARGMDSIVNMVSNSYGRWAKMYTKGDKDLYTRQCVGRLIDAGRLVSSYGHILLPLEHAEVTNTVQPRLIAPTDFVRKIPVEPVSTTHSSSSVNSEAMKVLSIQFGAPRKKDKIINQLCSSMGSLSLFSTDEKKKCASNILEDLVQEGSLIHMGGYYTLPSQ